VPDHERDAALIVIHASGLTREKFYAENPTLDDGITEKVRAMLKRRAMREPLQYILGLVEFCGMKIKVGPGVLVPRPETELIPEEVKARLGGTGGGVKVLDLCTGSGCIALSLAGLLTGAEVTGTDSSSEALGFARDNAQALGLEGLRFLEGDLFGPVSGERFSLVVANPPYIPAGEIDSLMPEVSRWEPRAALDGGGDGLDVIRKIAQEAPAHLEQGGMLIMELGAGQAGDVKVILEEQGFGGIETAKDLAGHERVIIARLDNN
jgi:release factor glutamine methyltransferase